MQKPYYEELEDIFLHAVNAKISSDGKLLADAIPIKPFELINQSYQNKSKDSQFDFKTFFLQNFKLSTTENQKYQTNSDHTIDEHIYALWNVLKREKDVDQMYSSLLPLPYPYIVPGGRFKEIYYWDSYFTMLGLREHNKTDIIASMVENFAYLIETFGYIPNGNRKYYLGRSQPPFFCLMVDLLAETLGDKTIYQKYLPHLIKEVEFFNCDARQRIINGHKLSVYYDVNATPRIEMFQDDIHLAENIEDKPKFYSDIRAACESGWDFSTRWLEDPKNLTTIHTSDIIPVDLNCLLYHLENTIGIHAQVDTVKVDYLQRAKLRENAILDLLWSEEKGFFMDYDTRKGSKSEIISCAGLFPLFFKVAHTDHVKMMIPTIHKSLFKQGGLVTTSIVSGQQWDAPNGWAPLQWIGVIGLDHYGYKDLACQIAKNWTSLNEKVFYESGKMMEKYNVEDLSLIAGGGEYAVQDGFGWTNGVYLGLKAYLKQQALKL